MAMNEIERVVDATIRRLRQEGLIRGGDDAEYRRGGDILRRFYRGGVMPEGITPENVARAISTQSADRYYEIIPLYYGDGATVEHLAEYFDCDTTTVARNKRRLVLAVSQLI